MRTKEHEQRMNGLIKSIHYALGMRFRKLPVRPEDVRQTLTERAASRAAE